MAIDPMHELKVLLHRPMLCIYPENGEVRESRHWPTILALLDECGLAVVPKVATEAMCVEMPDDIAISGPGDDEAMFATAKDACRIWTAMLAAAPKIKVPT